MLGTAGGIWAAYIPILRSRFGLDEAVLGIVLLTLAAGALLAMPATGWAIGRIGARKMTVATSIMAPLATAATLLSPELWFLFVAVFLQGAAGGALDVSMNIEAARVENARGRPSMSAFHAFYSVGGLAGAGVAALLLSLGLATGLAATGVLAFLVLAAFAVRDWYLRNDGSASERFKLVLPRGPLLVLGIIAFLSIGLEGAVGDWSAVFLVSDKGATPALAAVGFAAFSGAMAVMRFVGDALVGRYGRRLVVLAGGLVVALGCVVALMAPWPIVSAIGFGLIGIGASNMFPVIFSAAARFPSGTGGLPAVATLGYAGFLTWPPIIGWLAHGISLPVALSLIGIAGIAIAVGSRYVPR